MEKKEEVSRVENTKKILDGLGMLLLYVTIAVWNLIVGANEKGLRIFPMCILMIFMVCYLMIRKIILKQKMVVKNKIDLCVLLFMCSTVLPLIFRTYCSFQGTIEFILKYFFVYAVYLVVRNTVDSQKKVNALVLVTLLSSIIIAVIGIDVQHGGYLNWLLNKYNLAYTYCYALVASFGYANTVAIYFSCCIFLAIYEIQNVNRKFVKVFCGLYLVLAFYIVFQTLSRSVFVLLLGTIFVYFVLYYSSKLLKYKKRLFLVLGSGTVFAILGLAFIFGVAVKVSKPYELSGDYDQRNFNYDFKPNQEYTIDLELSSKGRVQVEILEVNTYFNSKVLAVKNVKPGEEKVSLKFTTTENLYQIDMGVWDLDSQKVVLNKCYIEGEEYPLNYKYLPYQIGKAITMYSANDKSIVQRTHFWKDCLKMAKMSPVIGQGGDTWKKLSQVVQDYPYGIKETHSYFFELLICYGVVGVTLYLVLIVALNIKVVKDCLTNKSNRYGKLAILFGLDLIILHSLCFDFDLSFVVILMTVFAYMGILMYDDSQNLQKSNVWDFGVFGFLGVLVIVLLMANMAQDLITDKKLKKEVGFYIAYAEYDYIDQCIKEDENFEENLQKLQKFIKNEPYFFQRENYEMYWNELLENLDQMDEKKIAEYIAFMNDVYRNIKPVMGMYIDTIVPRVTTMQKAYVTLSEKEYHEENLVREIEALNHIIQEQYETNKKNILDQDRNGYDSNMIESIMEEYESVLGI